MSMTQAEARIAVRTALTDHFREHGEYVDNLGQEVPIAALSARIGRRVGVASFEEALAVLERIHRLNDNTQTLAMWGYEVHPREHDYPQAKAHHIESAEQELTEHINNIAGSGPKGEAR